MATAIKVTKGPAPREEHDARGANPISCTHGENGIAAQTLPVLAILAMAMLHELICAATSKDQPRPRP